MGNRHGSALGERLVHESDVQKVESNYDKSQFKILVVDDECEIVDILHRILTNEGYTCQVCTEPQTAREWVSQKQFDLVLTDIQMPNMSGLKFADTIRRKDSQTQLAFMSGNKDIATLTTALNLEPVGFITKPFSQEKVHELVQRAFSHYCTALEKERLQKQLTSQLSATAKEMEFRSERLAAEQTLIHGIINNANFGMIATDTTGAVHLMNPLVSQMLGMPKIVDQSYVGLPLAQVVPPKIIDTLSRLMQEVLEDKALQEVDCIDGPNDTMLNIIAYPAFYARKISAIVFVVHDITEKKILQKQILQASKLASIGELAAGVAHEINNPLGFVMSNCNSLVEYLDAYKSYISALEENILSENCEQKNDTAKQQALNLRKELDIEYITEDASSLLEETLSGLKRMSKIVADLKTFAHADRVSPERAQVNTLLEDSLNLVKNQTKYNLEIVKEFSELPEITCFPNQLVQVFTNLFVNASHAVEDKGTLTIKTSASERAVTVSITDTGKGIPEKHLSKIFDPFFTTKEPGKGTGMGLSISHSIIEKHGGTIIVTSEVGFGTTFDIILPIQGLSDHSENKE